MLECQPSNGKCRVFYPRRRSRNSLQTTDMFVSFVLATFNCADLVPEFLQSLDNIGFDDYEVLVSDGGSVDSTVQLISIHERVKVIKSSPDTGIYDAWNCALPSCKGDYIAFIGIDDRPQGQFYRMARDYCEHSNSKPALIYGDTIRTRGARKRLRVTEKQLQFLKSNALVLDFSHPGSLNNRELFENIKFDPSYRLAGDLDFYLAIKSSLIEMGTVKIDAIQAIIGTDGLSNRAEAYMIYSNEFRLIGMRRNLDFTRLIYVYRIKSILGYFPLIFDLIRNVSWSLRGGA